MTRVWLLALVAIAVGIGGCGDDAPDGGPAGSKLPVPEYKTGSSGGRLGFFDTEELSSFLVSHELPPLEVRLPPIEGVACKAFADALAALEEKPNGERYGELGMFLHFYGVHDVARAAYEKASQLAPHDHRWHHLGGYLATQRGDAAEAERLFGLAYEKEGSYTPAALRLGRLYVQQNRLDEASRLFRATLEHDPHALYAIGELGYIAYRRGDLELAEKRLIELLDRGGSHPRAHTLLASIYTRREDESRALLHRALVRRGIGHLDPVPDPLVVDLRRRTRSILWLEEQAENQFRGGKFRECIESLRTLHARDPLPKYRARLSHAYLENRQYGEARRAATKLIADDPQSTAGLLALARVAGRTGDVDEAITTCRTILGRDPALQEAYVVLAQALASRGVAAARSPDLEAFAESITVADQLIVLAPQEATGYWLRGRILVAWAEITENAGDRAESLRLLAKARASVIEAARRSPMDRDMLGEKRRLDRILDADRKP